MMKRKTAFVDRCSNLWGSLDADCRKRLENVVNNPTDNTWDNAYSLILSGQSFMTLWQAVIAVDQSFPRLGPSEDDAGKRLEGWQRIPDQLTLYRAIKHATA